MAQLTAIILVLSAIVTVFTSGDSDQSSTPSTRATAAAAQPAKANPTPVADPPVIDGSTLYNSIAPVFIKRYNKVVGDHDRLGGTDEYCETQKDGGFDCYLTIRVALIEDFIWHYDADVDPATGCWTARTAKEFGGFQKDVDAYREDKFTAPSKSETAEYVRQAKKLRQLRGCIRTDGAITGEDDTAKFVAALASTNVKRRYPGEQVRTSCKTGKLVKNEIIPDDYEFKCMTTLADGRSFRDEISCFDEPPYEDYGACGESDGFPKKPLRDVPE